LYKSVILKILFCICRIHNTIIGPHTKSKKAQDNLPRVTITTTNCTNSTLINHRDHPKKLKAPTPYTSPSYINNMFVLAHHSSLQLGFPSFSDQRHTAPLENGEGSSRRARQVPKINLSNSHLSLTLLFSFTLFVEHLQVFIHDVLFLFRRLYVRGTILGYKR
jgi:hypothetical protein